MWRREAFRKPTTLCNVPGELVRSTKMAQDGGGPPPIEVAGGSMEGGRIPSPQPSMNITRSEQFAGQGLADELDR